MSALTAKKPKPEAKPQIPETAGDQPISVPFGTCIIPGAELLDYFDYKAVPIKVRSIATLWIIAITVGYRYYLGIVWALCWGKCPQPGAGTELVAILIDGRQVWGPPAELDDEGYIINSGSVPFDQQTPGYIFKPTFFGNEKQEGGINTQFVYYKGADLGYLAIPKVRDPYWQSEVTKRDATVKLPHYRDLAYLVWYGPSFGKLPLFYGERLSGNIGNTNRLWPIAFKVRRLPEYFGGGPVESGLGTLPGASGPHCNPITALYESYVNELWGMGLNPDEVDIDSFNAAATTIWSEGLGWSYLWTNASPVIELQNEILSFVSGTVYSDRQTQKIVCKLSRPDYNVEDLDTLTNDDFITIEEYLRSGWAPTKNEVRLTFTDQSTPDFKAETAFWQELANKQQRGETNPQEITFYGCPAMDQASRLAAREGRVVSTPLAQLTGILKRVAWRYHRGYVFKFTWPEEGITDLVMRVTNVRYGTILSPGIRLSCVEDIFKAGEATFGQSVATKWTDPLVADVLQATVVVGEIPYFMQRDSLTRVFELALRPNGAHINYSGVIDGNQDIIAADFTPSGLLRDEYQQLTADFDTVGLVIDTLADGELIEAASAAQIATDGRALAVIGDPSTNAHEWIAFESATYDSGAGTVTLDNVWRGLLDTTPQTWGAGVRIWFFDGTGALFSRTLSVGQTAALKAITRTPLTSLRIDQATAHNITTVGRANRPLPPAYVLLGGDYFDEQQDTGDLEFTWLERNRLFQSEVIKQSAADVPAESGVTYEVDIYGADDVLNSTVTGLTTAEFTYENSQEISDFGGLQVKLTLKFYSVRDALRSYTPFIRRVFRVDPGSFGNGDWILPPRVLGDVHATQANPNWDQLAVITLTPEDDL